MVRPPSVLGASQATPMVVSPGVTSTFCGAPGPPPATVVFNPVEGVDSGESPSRLWATTLKKCREFGLSPVTVQVLVLTTVAQVPAAGVPYVPLRVEAMVTS